MYCATIGIGVKQLWTKYCNTVSKNKSFLLLSWFAQAFFHSDKNLTNTENWAKSGVMNPTVPENVELVCRRNLEEF
jgi:hypothetical protein